MPTHHDSALVADLVDNQKDGNDEEIMLLKRWNGKLLAEQFNLPGMELEIERAVEQVQKSLAEKARASRSGSTVDDQVKAGDRKDQ